jgi:hypothetical protein
MQTEELNITESDGGGTNTMSGGTSSAGGPASGAPAGKPRRQMPKVDAGNLLLALLIVAGIGGVYLLKLRSGPSKASAEQIRTQSKVDQALLLLQRGGSLTGATQSARDVVDTLRYEAKSRQIPIERLPRNPFMSRVPGDAYGMQSGERLDVPTVTETQRAEVLAAARTMKLQSVLFGEGGGTALISDRPVRVGDRIGGWKVAEIRPSEVVLTFADLKYVLKVKMPH